MLLIPTAEDVARMSRDERISNYSALVKAIAVNRAQLDAAQKEAAVLLVPEFLEEPAPTCHALTNSH